MNFIDSSFDYFSTQIERNRGHSWITYLYLYRRYWQTSKIVVLMEQMTSTKLVDRRYSGLWLSKFDIFIDRTDDRDHRS